MDKDMMRAGANDFVSKPARIQEILYALRKVGLH